MNWQVGFAKVDVCSCDAIVTIQCCCFFRCRCCRHCRARISHRYINDWKLMEFQKVMEKIFSLSPGSTERKKATTMSMTNDDDDDVVSPCADWREQPFVRTRSMPFNFISVLKWLCVAHSFEIEHDFGPHCHSHIHIAHTRCLFNLFYIPLLHLFSLYSIMCCIDLNGWIVSCQWHLIVILQKNLLLALHSDATQFSNFTYTLTCR